MKRKLAFILLFFFLLSRSVRAEKDYIHWVDFDVSCAAMQRAISLDLASQGEERNLNWIELLALAAVRCGGKNVTAEAVSRAAAERKVALSVQEQLGELYRYYKYYCEAYTAALGGLVGNYAVQVTDPDTGEKVWKYQYGVKAFSPIAAGYWYSHYEDFGAGRSYGFARRHLGNDLMGSLGTPVVAVESGIVEALGWNQYGGWRIGIRSYDRKRYYYYAHLQKNHPYIDGLKEGDAVTAGDVIGFMGRTGYSANENTNNIDTVHLHFGMELVFDESQKECNSEIWIDVYDIVSLLDCHRSSVQYNSSTGRWERLYPFRDLDQEAPPDNPA